jgi:hypothetical protein
LFQQDLEDLDRLSLQLDAQATLEQFAGMKIKFERAEADRLPCANGHECISKTAGV